MSFKETVAKVIDKVLPFEDAKTKIGAWLISLGGLAELFPDIDFEAVIVYLVSHPTKAGMIAVILGLAHKWARSQREDLPSIPKF